MGKPLSKTLLLAFLIIVLLPTLAFAKKPNKKRSNQSVTPATIGSLACFSSERYTRFVIHLNKVPEFSHGYIPEDSENNLPARLYIDLANTEPGPDFDKGLDLPSGPITAMRLGKQPQKGLRLVLDLTTNQNYKITTLQNPTRLAIDIVDINPVVEDINTGDFIPNQPLTAVESNPKVPKSHFLIVLDPGHGGDDTGAIGPTGLQEKNVALELALLLRDELSQNKNYEILLTRERDQELELKERSNFANNHQADLFISLHSNASTESGFGGFSVYYLNNTSDKFSQRLAAVENSATEEDLSPADLIINDLKMNKITVSSQKLAQELQHSAINAISSEDPPIKDRGVLTALFYVLLGARMPAALVECNFISNPHEETLLASPAYRKKIAQGLASGIKSYLQSEN